jgi:mono/diheme cytochrome c family protein
MRALASPRPVPMARLALMARLVPIAPIAVFAAFATLAVALVRADDQDAGYSAANGRQTFRTYCASCHGEDGTGDGYIADTLRTRPADLTRIALRNGGVYPAERIWKTIDGREEVKTHGRREMPVWGDVFLWPEGDTPERQRLVERKIGELVEYLRTIQITG